APSALIPPGRSVRFAQRAPFAYFRFFSMSWIVPDEHTAPGWSPVALQIAAVIRLAEPMIALACVELGSFKASATACQLMPPTVSGEYIAPEIAYRFAMSMNGIVPPGS